MTDKYITEFTEQTSPASSAAFLIDEGSGAYKYVEQSNLFTGANCVLGAGRDLIGSATSDITINTNKFTVAGATGNTVVAGTFDVTGALGAAASITLGAGADLIGSATSDITINTNKFTVAGATGNTVIAGTASVAGDLYTTAWTDWGGSSNATGYSSVSIEAVYYKKIGKQVFVSWFISGTSNATTKTFTLPSTHVNNTVRSGGALIEAQDNGSILTVASRALVTPNSSTVTLYSNMGTGAWTNSGAHYTIGNLTYEEA